MGKKEFSIEDAEWIGNPRGSDNTFGVDAYTVSGEYRAESGLGLVINARDKENYILVDIGMSEIAVREICGNERGETGAYDRLLLARAASVGGGRHTFSLSVNRRALSLTVDGGAAIDSADILPENPDNQPRKSFMMFMGLKQDTPAEIYRLTVRNDKNGKVYQDEYFKDDGGILSALGAVKDGVLYSRGFEIVCPSGAVNVRRRFTARGEIASARLYASARGFYTAYINNRRVGGDFYAPGFTDYRLRIQYQTYDVTDMIREGRNVIGATVCKGYYSGFCGYSGCGIYGEENAFTALLVLEYRDGAREAVFTDGSWEFTDKGGALDSDYLDGEYYDARYELDWTAEDSRWKKCGVKPRREKVIPTNGELPDLKFMLSAQKGPSAECVCKLNGTFAGENPKGHFLYDFGQNMVGTVRLTMKAARGKSVKIRYGEMLKGGALYTDNLRTAAAADIYTFSGNPRGEVFVPSFTSHGFRYMEISGCGCDVDRGAVISAEGLVISNVSKITGDFECSNPLLNRLQKNIQWGQRGNSLLIFTDCPQRNERMGWTGDAQIFASTGAYNMDIKEFARKWLCDLRDSQLLYNKNGAVPDTAPLGGDNRPDGCGGWGDAAVIVPWELYMAYGDARILEENYDMMKMWVEYQSLPERQNYGLRTVDGVPAPEKSDLASIPFIQVQQRRGDHLSLDASTPHIYCATAYAAHSADILSRTADVLCRHGDARKYRARFENIRRAFNEAWVEEDGSISYWGEMSGESGGAYYSDLDGSRNHPSQTAYALAIDFDLIPAKKLKRAGERLKAAIEGRGGSVSAGFLGISHLIPALTKAGFDEAAYELLMRENSPGWLYSVKSGATTIWERWDSYVEESGAFGDAKMNSFNHYAYGAVGEWLFSRVLGIKPVQAGYKSFELSPCPGGGLKYARGYHISPYGTIKSAWEVRDNKLVYNCSVPADTTAALRLPNKEEIRLSGGDYSFTVDLKQPI